MRGNPHPETAAYCTALLAVLPASLSRRKLRDGGKWLAELDQTQVDVIYAALSHHEEYCRTGWHEDAAVGEIDPAEILARLDRIEAALAVLAAELQPKES
ncbi:MAG TPA: hypothetical protein VGR91_19385 [Stellaceae bacterium]|nr:hypothetical protein [Stellaceae bacterium]